MDKLVIGDKRGTSDTLDFNLLLIRVSYCKWLNKRKITNLSK